MAAQVTSPIFRMALVSLLAALGGALVYTYIIPLKQRERWPAMAWGAASAVMFILVALLSQIERLNEPITWRGPAYLLATLFGLNALRLRHKGE